jgi:predicted GIY-YIG superfamily endonuclease
MEEFVKDYNISGNQFRAMKETGIYVWKRGNDYLYIGISNCMGRRITTHTIIDVIEPVLEDDIIQLVIIDKEQLEQIEQAMIKVHRPKYNTIHNDFNIRQCEKCPVLYKPTKHNQKYCMACGPKQINRKYKNY